MVARTRGRTVAVMKMEMGSAIVITVDEWMDGWRIDMVWLVDW